jgi:Zn-dependent M28 family amino/carboxypeptidase
MAAAFSRAKAEGKNPRRSIIFMTVSGEEEGLWGSEYYSGHPLFPLSKTSIDINTDMVGRIDPKRNYGDSMNYLYVIGDDTLSSDLAPLVDSVNNKWTHLEVDRKYNDLKDPNKFYYRSDHFNFAKKGVPVIFLFNRNTPRLSPAKRYHRQNQLGFVRKAGRIYLPPGLGNGQPGRHDEKGYSSAIA